jgi:hypothetical protein
MTMMVRSHTRVGRLGVLVALGALAALPAGTAGAAPSSPAICSPTVDTGVLPPWARGGFSAAKPRIAHVTGRAGSIMAIFFARPLEAPPAKTHNNKILWVARVGTQTVSDLRIGAQRMLGAHNVGGRVSRVVNGGPGPSIIDLPAAGCWRLALHWAGHSDTLDVRYAHNKN